MKVKLYTARHALPIAAMLLLGICFSDTAKAQGQLTSMEKEFFIAFSSSSREAYSSTSKNLDKPFSLPYLWVS